MKNKASGFYADSLEMLLDTMCNVLGAVVFITLALAALAPNSHAPAPEELQHQAAELANTLAAKPTTCTCPMSAEPRGKSGR
jgi:hypothetical protein